MGHRISILCLLACATSLFLAFHTGSAAAQETDFAGHFRVYTGEGTPASLDDVVRAMADVDAVLLGETHTDPVAHWLEAKLFRRTLEHFRVGEDEAPLRHLALSLEFFERDVQQVIDEYLAGLISERHFMDDARAAEYYEEDHRPMVELARERGVQVIASNAPRRYVNRVSRNGREALFDLPPHARRYLPPLPYPEPSEAYRAQWRELMSTMTMEDRCPVPDSAAAPHAMPPSPHGPPGGGMPDSFMENGLQAQALWDASMAYAITTFLHLHPGAMVFHVVGGFHVESFTGTPEIIEYYRPGTRTLVVSMEQVEDITVFDPEEFAGRGSFVILTDEVLDMNIARNCPGLTGGS